jgi:hypothetical protein
MDAPANYFMALRLGDGRASQEDKRLAERLVTQLVFRLPPDNLS